MGKLGFSTFGNKSVYNTADFTTSSQTMTDKVTTTLNAGTYIVVYTVVFSNLGGTANGECNTRIKYGASSYTPPVVAYLNNASFNSATNSFTGIMTVASDNTAVSLQTSVNWPARGTYTTWANGASVSFIRVG